MYLGRENDIFVRLFETDGVTPNITVSWMEPIINIWKHGLDAWETVSLSIDSWINLGDGSYVLRLGKEHFNIVGPMVVKFESIAGTTFLPVYKELEVVVLPLQMCVEHNKCIVTGNMADLSGNTCNKSYDIVFRIVSLPNHVAGVTLISSEKIRTVPDVFGNFSVALIVGSCVVVESAMLGLKVQVTIPDLPTINIIDLLPPFPTC